MSLNNYFYCRRLIEHYEAQASKCQAFGALSFGLVGIILIMGLLLITNPVVWLIIFIPMFGFAILGIVCMCNAQEAEEMIEYIKWRM